MEQHLSLRPLAIAGQSVLKLNAVVVAFDSIICELEAASADFLDFDAGTVVVLEVFACPRVWL